MQVISSEPRTQTQSATGSILLTTTWWLDGFKAFVWSNRGDWRLEIQMWKSIVYWGRMKSPREWKYREKRSKMALQETLTFTVLGDEEESAEETAKEVPEVDDNPGDKVSGKPSEECIWRISGWSTGPNDTDTSRQMSSVNGTVDLAQTSHPELWLSSVAVFVQRAILGILWCRVLFSTVVMPEYLHIGIPS